MKWNADLYQGNHNFVTEYGKGLLEYITDDTADQSILDLGCGTGELTYELAKKAGTVIGIDSSQSMIQKAKATYPQIEFHVMDACKLIWQNHFDVVFSNAVFHWIPDQASLLGNIHRVLKTGGRLICEFGAHGNVVKIRSALHNVLKGYGYDNAYPFYLPTSQEYMELLKQAGFNIQLITDYDRPTPLKDGELGLRNWLKQFFASDLSKFTEGQQVDIFEAVENALRPKLWDGVQWVADYRRIRVIASTCVI
ncbi:MAG: methyltransferase domain-containing protein [Defluviitaleaceae bacterium]|nr:methyltransferase domain-containing protein [Defluviitaleaceae bacterium]